MLSLKQGVRVLGIRPELLLALMVAESIYRDRGTRLVVTSLIDGAHSVGSLHYAGAAADLRLPPDNAPAVVTLLKEALGADYDVVLEADHIHLEFQPKQPY
ncbi:MAG: hypothetical protein L0Z53_06730 [Acidobacteriales bacterium]|nr:hypothetical protein [Terriglobales bacterium]